jgi:dTDP-4-dehydrorhamnose 3,5-epimerase
MKVEPLSLADVKLLVPRRHADARGYFVEIYNRRAFARAGIANAFIQDNESCSKRKGTVRGLHYQAPPKAQAKLVRVVKGAVFDVVVDARKDSPTFGKWAGVELAEGDGRLLFIPAGFLHGLATLKDDTIVAYKVDALYDASLDGAVRWNDPDLGIDWRVDPGAAVVSEKDAAAPAWRDFKSPF